MATRPSFVVSERFELAIDFAIELHRNQARKRSPGEPGPPYVGHLLGVTGLVLEDGGSQDEAIAALLHDSIEDQNEPHLSDHIREKFGERVLQIVKGASAEENSTEQKADRGLAQSSWRDRKRRYIANLETADQSTLRVSLADKLWNVNSLLRDHDAIGDEVWDRFNAEARDQLWYYEELTKRYRERIDSPMVTELERAVDRLRTIVRD